MYPKEKYCPKCDKTKPRKDFHKRGEFLMGYCKPCQRTYVNRAKAALLVRLRGIVREAKDNQPCTDCGERHPYWAMDFDHLDPSAKCFDISSIGRSTPTEKRLRAELAKCELVCALCHRYRTNGSRRSKTGM